MMFTRGGSPRAYDRLAQLHDLHAGVAPGKRYL